MLQTSLKRVIFNARRADIDDDRFLGHWLTTHAPLVVAAPDYGRYVTGYRQAMALRGLGLPYVDWPAEFLGLSEFWPRDLPDGVPPLAATEYFRQVIGPDVDLFVDRDRSMQAFVDEEVLTEGEGAYRMIFLLRRKPGLADSGFAERLAADLGRMRDTPDLWGHVTGHARGWLRPGGLTAYSGAPVTGFAFDLIEAFSFRTPRCALAAFQSPGYRDRIAPLEADFLDGGRRTGLLVRDAIAFG